MFDFGYNNDRLESLQVILLILAVYGAVNNEHEIRIDQTSSCCCQSASWPRPVYAFAPEIKNSPTGVQNYIKRTGSAQPKKKLGRPSTITLQLHCAVLRSKVRAPKERATASTLVSKYREKAGVRRIQQLMQDADHLLRTHITRAPRLSDDQKPDRLNWAKAQL